MNVLFLGATQGMGRALARRLAEDGSRLYLLGRSADDLRRSAEDLAQRGASGSVEYGLCDLLDPTSFEDAIERAHRALPDLDTVIISAAQFATQELLESCSATRRSMLRANVEGTIELCESVRRRLHLRGGGTLCVFSSVAGDRPRKPVALYGASKAALSFYLRALDLRYRHEGLRVLCVKPGFVRTSMTEGLDPPPFSTTPEQAARTVAGALAKGQRGTVYVPGIWRLVMAALRVLPDAVMRRVSF